jgi:amidase
MIFSLSFRCLALWIFCCVLQMMPMPSHATVDTLPVINPEHPNSRMRFKVMSSHFNSLKTWLAPFESALNAFPETRYRQMAPLVLGKTIPELQQQRANGVFTYEELTLFFLKRIADHETDPAKSLNAVISIHPQCLQQAKMCDKGFDPARGLYTMFGMPILIKDNIQVDGLPTTAGAEVLKGHKAPNAFIAERLEENGAVVLGKANLSEWAYYFCDGCPVGYSAMGGQTLNPYGKGKIESGGSSSGSGVAVAAGYAVAAVGSETSGSILSPSGMNSIVGLKPTIGTLSRTGIVPISYTLDTPGPMTGSCVDNAILYNAMLGRDPADKFSVQAESVDVTAWNTRGLMGRKLGVIRDLLADSIYGYTVDLLEAYGAEIVAIDLPAIDLSSFLTLLNMEMREALPAYLKEYGSADRTIFDIADIVAYNKQNLDLRAPYGQQRFEALLADATSPGEFVRLREKLLQDAAALFSKYWDMPLDAIVSLSNYHAAYAALARVPCLTVPGGYRPDGSPVGITFIGPPLSESALLSMGHAFELRTAKRKLPEAFSAP